MPKCIDLLLRNRNRSFQNSCVIDRGLSDLHKMTVTRLRSHLNKLGRKIIHYRDYKNFSNNAFRSELKAIMKRIRLKNKFVKYRCEGNKRAYNAQRNLCFSSEKGKKKITLIILASETSLIKKSFGKL